MWIVKILIPPLIVFAVILLLGRSRSNKPFLLIAERTNIIKYDFTVNSGFLYEGPGPVQVLNKSLFIYRDRHIIVTNLSGKEIRRIPIPEEVLDAINYVVIPDGRFAFLDNRNDAVYFVSPQGKYLKTVHLEDEPDNNWQSIDGIVVGNDLVICQSSCKSLLKTDLTNYNVSVFCDLARGFSNIIRVDGNYYLSNKSSIYYLDKSSDDLKKIASTDVGNVTALACFQGRLFAVVNGVTRTDVRSLSEKYQTTAGVLYEIVPETGEVLVVLDNLNYPQDLIAVGEY